MAKKTNKSWGFDTGFYRSKKWLLVSKKYKNKHPICELCKSVSLTTAGAYLDHIAPRRLLSELEYEEANFQHLCAKCHSQKTALEARISDKDEWIREFTEGKLKFICVEEKRMKLLGDVFSKTR